jgi:HPt (histidine-containing phosphotransfer) domain-containing protein
MSFDTHTPLDPAPMLDHAAALSRSGGDPDLLKELAGLFLDEYPKSLTQLHEAIQQGDAGVVERAAHSLKGSVANFGALPAVKAAQQIELLGREQNLAGVGIELERLEAALGALKDELERLD